MIFLVLNMFALEIGNVKTHRFPMYERSSISCYLPVRFLVAVHSQTSRVREGKENRSSASYHKVSSSPNLTPVNLQFIDI